MQRLHHAPSSRQEFSGKTPKMGEAADRGFNAYVDGSHLAAGTVVPDRAIMIKDKIVGFVEW